MSGRGHIATRVGTSWLAVGLLIALSCGLGGCARHKPTPVRVVILPPRPPVPLETLPMEAKAPLVDAPAPSAEKLPAVPTAAAATKPTRQRRKPKPVVATTDAPAPAATNPASTGAGSVTTGAATGTPAPVQVAANAPNSLGTETVIGSLTPGGGDQSPQARQDAEELLLLTDKRLNALPTRTQQDQRAQISKIRNFWKQGQEALRSGDAEGAKTLATKAKLLLDDLEGTGQ